MQPVGIEWMGRQKVKDESMELKSSLSVYGEPEFLPLTEEHSTGKCTNPYGKSKFFTEEILRDLCDSDKVRN